MRKKLPWSPHTRLGQHFLIDAHIRDRIVSSLKLQPSDMLVEIGAGKGFLTEVLASHVQKLWAIELDPHWVMTLKSAFINSKKVEVVAEDVLKIDFHQFLGDASPAPVLRVVGNLPYYISSPILFRLFDHASIIRDATLMVQREMGDRITATPTSKNYGYASLATQLFCQVEELFTVPPSAFSPPPRVHSSVVHLTLAPRATLLELDNVVSFLKFAQQIFLEKRKTLLNNLKRMISAECRVPHAKLQGILAECGLELKVRAENVSLESTAKLYRTLRHRGFL